jgi:hypothetical protein
MIVFETEKTGHRTHMQMFHSLDIFSGRFGCVLSRIFQLSAVEEFGGRVGVGAASTCTDLLDKFCIDLATANGFHHGQMLKVIVSLKERVASEELDNDTTYAPNVAGKAPAKLQNDLGGSVMSRRDNRAVILIIECCRPKVYEADLAVQQYSPLTGCPRGGMR